MFKEIHKDRFTVTDNTHFDKRVKEVLHILTDEHIFDEVCNTLLAEQIIMRLITERFYLKHEERLVDNKVVYITFELNGIFKVMSVSTLNNKTTGVVYCLLED